MISYREWRLRESGGLVGPVSPSQVDDEGDGIEQVLKNHPHPAMDGINPKELPPTRKNGGREKSRPIFSKKK
jgi:hypothetical protein